MEFTEFREKFNINPDRLHKLTLEALDLYNIVQEDEKEWIESDNLYGDYEYSPGSAREEYLYGFLRLLMEEDD